MIKEEASLSGLYRGEVQAALEQLKNPVVPFFNQPLPLDEAMRVLNDRTYPWMPTILFKLDTNTPPAKEALEFDLKENYNQVAQKEELVAKLDRVIKEKLIFMGELPLKVTTRR